jgi:hypothetical protein
MNSKKNKIIVWKVQDSNSKIASTRIRCLLPIIYLQKLGYTSVIIQINECIDTLNNCHALVFVKSFSKDDYLLALKAYENNIPIILDLCDNIFTENYPKLNSAYFIQMAKLAAAIVTTNHNLAGLIKLKTLHKNVMVIPDQAEELNNLQEIIKNKKKWAKNKFLVTKNPSIKSIQNKLSLLANYKWYIKIAHTLYRNFRIYFDHIKIFIHGFFMSPKIFDKTEKKLKRIIWFGNHGAPYSSFGINSLLLIRNDLEKINKLIPIELIVVSNNREKFEEYISKFKLRTTYKKWDMLNIFNEIKKSDVTVIPILNDDFTFYKSNNRAILSLSLGTPVVASSTNMTLELSDCIYLDNFYEGILTYLTNPVRVESDLKKVENIIKNNYSSCHVGKLWDDLLEKYIT